MIKRLFKPTSILLIALVLMMGLLSVRLAPVQKAQAQTTTLRALADARGFLIGTAANPTILQNNAPYANVVKTEYNLITPGNAMKMDALQPTEGTFTYTDADSLVSFAKANNMKVHGHVFIWHSQYPGWLSSKTQNRATFLPIMENHIKNVAQHFGTDIWAWDVVNEAIEDNGTLRSSIWSNSIGSDFIDQAFTYARQYTPAGTKLIYNDYNVETINVKSNYMYDMVKSMKTRGIPIDAVGLQMHIHVWDAPTYEQVRSNIARFAALGVEVYISEMDVALGTVYPALPTAAQLDQQKQIYAYITKACLDVPGCKGLTTWGVTDGDSWLNGFLGDYEHPMLFDRSYAKKPAYDGVSAQLATVSATNTPIPPTATMVASGNAVRINAGAAANYTDTAGHLWLADTGFTPDSAAYDGQSVSVVTNDDPKIYQSARENMSDYLIPVTNGTYTVRLHFAETSPSRWGTISGAGQRVFNVSVESSTLNNLDIYGQTGGKNVAIVKVFNVTVSDGMMNIHFSPVSSLTGAPIIQGIEILPGGPVATSTARPTLTPTMTATPIAPGGNLLINPGFETGTTSPWSCLGSSCSIFSTNTTVHGGTYGGFVTNRTDTWMGAAQNVQYLSYLTNGGSYTASAWVRAASTPLNLQLVIKYTDGAGDHYTGLGSFTSTTTGAWTQLSGNFNLSWTGTLTAVSPFIQSNESGTFADYYVDDAFFGLVAGSATNTPIPTATITPGGPTLTPTRTPTITLTPTITNTPAPGLQVKIQSAGTDNTSQSTFNLQIVNTGVASLSNVTWRFYFTPDNGNAATAYALDKYFDQSGVATVSGPTLACNNIYYFTVSYGTTAMPAGTIWAYNSAFHLSSYASTYDGSNDFWHTGYAMGALPAAFTTDYYFPGYQNGSLIWGNEPNCGTVTNTPVVTPTVTLTPSRTLTSALTMTVTVTPSRTLTPAITSTPTRTFTPVNTNTITRTPTAGPTSTRTNTPVNTNTPTRTPTTGATVTRTNTPVNTNTPTRTPTVGASNTPTATATSVVGACSPVTSTITVPFTFDGAGTFCWQASTLGTYINSWNTTSVTVNGTNYSNVYVTVASFPAKINGFWYIGYSSSVTFGHFEAK
jgi:endo-1,4-beta-xylanase